MQKAVLTWLVGDRFLLIPIFADFYAFLVDLRDLDEPGSFTPNQGTLKP